jgi:phage host-nuclease inhibitor protein Gam
MESDVASLGAATADGRAKLGELRREVARLKAQLSDCYAKMKQNLTNPEQEPAKLKEEVRELGILTAAMADKGLRHSREICDLPHEVELMRQASDRWESQE